MRDNWQVLRNVKIESTRMLEARFLKNVHFDFVIFSLKSIVR